jgi:inhibitor of KinA sporulation pathway (predicted exonuclease)
MSNDFNKIVVVDLEATCWEDKEYQKENSEIIEIGVCTLNTSDGSITDSRSIYVIPEKISEKNKYPVISDYCINLTGITLNKLLKQGKSLEDAFKELKKNYSTSKIWMSWGNSDRVMIERECKEKGLEYPFKHGKHINAKDLFGLIRKNKRGVGMKKALEILNIPLIGNHHSGKDDAYNTAQIIAKILNYKEENK